MSHRVLVVDESDLSRDGYSHELNAAGAHVTGAVCHDQIDTLDDDALRVDIAVVNLADPRRDLMADDFPGIGAVCDILRRTDRPPLIVGYTTFWDHPGLRLRAGAAGVGVIFSRSELEDDHFEAPLGETIVRLGLSTESNLDPMPGHEEQRFALGLSTLGDYEALVADAQGLLVSRSMIGQQAQFQVRKDFGIKHGVDARTKEGMTSDQRWPSWDQIDRIWRWLAKT